jgi:hypothetical protein
MAQSDAPTKHDDTIAKPAMPAHVPVERLGGDVAMVVAVGTAASGGSRITLPSTTTVRAEGGCGAT